MEAGRTFRPADHARFDATKMAKVPLYRSDRVMVGLNCFEPGQTHALHAHAGSEKLYVIVEGRARFTLGVSTVDLESGAVAVAPAGEPHALENIGSGRLTVVVLMAPPPIGA